MKTEFEKYMHIADELLSYCHIRGASDFHLAIKEREDATYFTITALPKKIDDEEIEHLTKVLQAPRRREMEKDYWSLGGISEVTSELLLIGMMVDEASVDYNEGWLTIKLKRLN